MRKDRKTISYVVACSANSPYCTMTAAGPTHPACAAARASRRPWGKESYGSRRPCWSALGINGRLVDVFEMLPAFPRSSALCRHRKREYWEVKGRRRRSRLSHSGWQVEYVVFIALCLPLPLDVLLSLVVLRKLASLALCCTHSSR